jgi:hypothetical protein
LRLRKIATYPESRLKSQDSAHLLWRNATLNSHGNNLNVPRWETNASKKLSHAAGSTFDEAQGQAITRRRVSVRPP